MRRMLDEQVIPRLLKIGGITGVTKLKRFHSFGIGESRADEMLAGIPGLAIDGTIKLGFQAHYPQLETKLAARGADEADLAAKLTPPRPRCGGGWGTSWSRRTTRRSRASSSEVRPAATRWQSARPSLAARSPPHRAAPRRRVACSGGA